MLAYTSWQVYLSEWLAYDEIKIMADEIFDILADTPCSTPKFRRELEMKDTVIQDLLANGWDSDR